VLYNPEVAGSISASATAKNTGFLIEIRCSSNFQISLPKICLQIFFGSGDWSDIELFLHICLIHDGKQAFHDYRSRGSGQANQRAGQLILDFCGVGFLTAYACFASGSLATGGLLTLVTKHSRFPFIS
jgi:hypothetical protein